MGGDHGFARLLDHIITMTSLGGTVISLMLIIMPLPNSAYLNLHWPVRFVYLILDYMLEIFVFLKEFGTLLTFEIIWNNIVTSITKYFTED